MEREENKSKPSKQKLVYRSILRNDRARPNALDAARGNLISWPPVV